MSKKPINRLRLRAEKMLKDCQQNRTPPSQDMSQLIDELTLHQIELEIQNEDLMKIQAELHESHKRYVELYDLAPVGYFAFNEDGLIKEVNQAGCQLLGLKKSALINRCFSRYIANEHQTLFAQYRQRAYKEKTLQSFELKLLQWNQASFYAAIECKVLDNTPNQMQLLAFVTDISARKQTEESLHAQRIKMASIDRMRSISEFIYGMAQEQNNPLMMMDHYLQGSIKRLESNNYQLDDILVALKKAAQQSKTLFDIVQNRKRISSKSVFHYVQTNINTLIRQTLSLLTHEILEFPVLVQYSESKNVSNVKLDIFHVQQAILNLARNAIEAMRDAKVKEPKLLIEIAETDTNAIEVVMYDNGPGLMSELIPRLFDAHFTTKTYAIGLGLTVSRAIIEKHGGQLYATSNPSGGACFGFTLPTNN